MTLVTTSDVKVFVYCYNEANRSDWPSPINVMTGPSFLQSYNQHLLAKLRQLPFQFGT